MPSAKLSGDARVETETTLRHTRDETERDHRSLPTDSLLRRHGSSTCAARPAEKVRTATGGAPLVAPVPGRRPTSRCATPCSHSTGQGPVPPETLGARRRARNAPDPSLIDTLLRQELSSRHAFRQAVRGCPPRDRNHAAAHARRDGADHRSLPTDSLLRRHGSSTCAARPARESPHRHRRRTPGGAGPWPAPHFQVRNALHAKHRPGTGATKVLGARRRARNAPDPSLIDTLLRQELSSRHAFRQAVRGCPRRDRNHAAAHARRDGADHRSLPTDSLLRRHGSSTCAARPAEKVRTATGGAPLRGAGPWPAPRFKVRNTLFAKHRPGTGATGSPRGAAQSEERTRPQLDRHPSPPGAILAPCLPPSCPGMPASRFETTLRHTRDETEQIIAPYRLILFSVGTDHLRVRRDLLRKSAPPPAAHPWWRRSLAGAPLPGAQRSARQAPAGDRCHRRSSGRGAERGTHPTPA